MKITLNKIIDNLIWILTVFLLVTYLVFETYTWGRYAYLGVSVAILLLSAYLHKGRIRIKAVPYYGFMLAFIGYTAMSSLWALNMADSITKAVTITLILICNIMVYVHYQYEENVEKLLRAVMWAGYIVAIYAIAFYGFDFILLAAENKRIVNEFSNVNTIGMATAISCVIQVHELLYKTKYSSAIFMIPCVVVIAATQSRTALALLAMGVFWAFFLKSRENKNVLRRFVRIAIIVVAALGMLLALYTLPIFDGIRIRVNQMVAGFRGEAGADASTIIRQNMIALGWDWFLRYPIGGVGIGNPHILVGRYLADDTYLHNNFVEILCGGGIVGFLVYYSMYVYVFLKLLKYRDADRKYSEIGLTLLLTLLIVDFGTVSYYIKQFWFYFMILFLDVSTLRRKGKET